MATSRLQIAKPDIVAEFERHPPVFTVDAIAEIFNENRAAWRLAVRTSLRDFVEYLLRTTKLRRVEFKFPQRPVVGYVWGEVPQMETLLCLVRDGFYSHYTAVRIHGLTEQVPKTIYLNHERPGAHAGSSAGREPLEQEAIDKAFRSDPRESHNEIALNGERIVFLSSAFQGGLGITSGSVNLGGSRPLKLRYTTLERTLIDITVRPFYAGGVFEVAKAYENARDHASGNTMAALIKRMNFAYPYHQAIGYYLERARYRPTVVALFKSMPMKRDFYLTHGGETTYVPEWRLYVPKGF